MSAHITSVLPKPVTVISGGTEVLTVHLYVTAEHPGARLVMENRKPEAADLFDADERADRIESERKDLATGTDRFVHEVGFELAAGNDRGALIVMDVHVEDADGGMISGRIPVTVNIHAG